MKTISMRRYPTKSICVIIFLSCLIFYNHYIRIHTEYILYDGNAFAPQNVPTIMAWTQFYNSNLTEWLQKNLEGCSSKCEVVDKDESSYTSAHAIIFHGRNSFNVPPIRYSQQKYVLMMLEPPTLAIHILPPNLFNSSLTYRRESELNYSFTYGSVRKLKKPRNEDEKIDAMIRKKQYGSLIIVSHCETSSKREAYVTHLSKYTDVTERGKCSGVTWDCARGSECEIDFIESHRFYLAFENSVCEEYVTEKFFRASNYIVPVVLKRSILEDRVPPGMFIAADDFVSPRDLADYLNELGRNDTEYKKYFSWRNNYEIVDYKADICQLCADLHVRNRTPTVIPDITQYWNVQNQCLSGYAMLLGQ